MEYKEADIKCPFLNYIKAKDIFCESVDEKSDFTHLHFATKAKRNEYIYDFCACRCFVGCPIYCEVIKKYDIN